MCLYIHAYIPLFCQVRNSILLFHAQFKVVFKTFLTFGKVFLQPSSFSQQWSLIIYDIIIDMLNCFYMQL